MLGANLNANQTSKKGDEMDSRNYHGEDWRARRIVVALFLECHGCKERADEIRREVVRDARREAAATR